jgi:hypothetical protein
VAAQNAATGKPKRINKAIELLEQGQPIYYTSGRGGFEEGDEDVLGIVFPCCTGRNPMGDSITTADSFLVVCQDSLCGQAGPLNRIVMDRAHVALNTNSRCGITQPSERMTEYS